MNSKAYSVVYDIISLFLINIIFINLINTDLLIKIFCFNFFIVIFFFFTGFYKKSGILKIFDKLKIIFFVCFILAISKFLFFGVEIYFEFIVFQDLLLGMFLTIPRILLNIKEFKINFIKNYHKSRQGTLVIGGLGYIGSGVVSDLLKNGSKVSVLDCCMYGEDVLNKFNKYPNFNFIKGYASDVILLGKLLKENSKLNWMADEAAH